MLFRSLIGGTVGVGTLLFGTLVGPSVGLGLGVVGRFGTKPPDGATSELG